MGHTQQLARGMFWLGSATLASRLIDGASSIVVLRVLTGAELGAATLAMTVSTFVEGFNSLGINNVIIQRAKLSAEQTSSVWWYVLAVACVMTGGMMLAAPLVALAYGAEELTGLVQLASLKLLFVSLASVPLALLNRQLQFREIGAIMACATLFSAALTIILALNGAGAWAPLAGNTAHGLFQFLGTCVFGFYRPRSGFSWAHVAPMARDGVKLAGAVSIGQLTRNVDYLVLGKVVGLDLLGTYRVAFDLAMFPSMLVLQISNRASFPIYSRTIGDGGDLSRAFARTLKMVALLLIPLLVVAALGGEHLFQLLDKAHPGDVAVVIATLCVAAWLRGLSQCTPVLLIATGHATRAFLQAASSAALLALAIVGGLQAWPEADPLFVTACGWVVSSGLQLIVDFVLSRRSVSLARSEWLEATVVPAGVALLVAAVASVVRRLFPIDIPVLALVRDGFTIGAVFALILRYGLKVRGLRELRPKPRDTEAPARRVGDRSVP